MSDDTRNDSTPDRKKNEPINLFGRVDSNDDPNPSQEERGVSADDEAEDNKGSTETTEAGPVTEPPESGPAGSSLDDSTEDSVGDSVGESEQEATRDGEREKRTDTATETKTSSPINDSTFGEESSLFTIAKATELRRQAAFEPTIVGKDAHLVRYDAAKKEIVPRDDKAAAVLEALGEDVDIKAAYSGSFIAKPLKLGDDGKITNNPASAAERLASKPEDRKSISMLAPESIEEKLARSNAARRARRLSEDDPKNKDEDRVTAGNRDHTLTPGAAVAASVGKGLQKLGEGLSSLWKKFWATIKKMFSAVVGAGKNALERNPKEKNSFPEESLKEGESTIKASGLNLDETNRKLKKMRDDPLTPNATANASGSMGAKTLQDRISERNQQNLDQVSGHAEQAIQGHQESLKNGIGAIERGLHLNEIGQIPLHSHEDFETRARRSSPEDKRQITEGLQSLVNGTKTYRDDVNGLLNSDQMESVKPADRQKILNRLLQEGTKGASRLPEHQQKVIDHASVQGQSVKAKMSEMFSNSQAILETRIGQDASAQRRHANTQSHQGPTQNAEHSEPLAPQ